MTKRKLLLAALALCMVSILALGTTLAYLTDDEQANNTMVIGDVKINIDELVYDSETKAYEEFVNNEFTLYPVANAVHPRLNKMVFTFNASEVTDNDSGYAYIRNIILFEANPSLDSSFEGEDGSCEIPGIHFSYTSANGEINGKKYYGTTNYVLETPVTLSDDENATKYWVLVSTIADETSSIEKDAALLSMHSVWVDKNINSDQMAAWGEELEIKVFSQGIQAEGLTHAQAMEALGEVNQTNLRTWFADTTNNATINDIF